MSKKLWKITIFNGKIHYKWPCSIAMLVYVSLPEGNYIPGLSSTYSDLYWPYRPYSTDWDAQGRPRRPRPDPLWKLPLRRFHSPIRHSIHDTEVSKWAQVKRCPCSLRTMALAQLPLSSHSRATPCLTSQPTQKNQGIGPVEKCHYLYTISYTCWLFGGRLFMLQPVVAWTWNPCPSLHLTRWGGFKRAGHGQRS